MINKSIEWSIDCLIDRLIGRLIDWLNNWSIDWLIDWLFDRSIDWLSKLCFIFARSICRRKSKPLTQIDLLMMLTAFSRFNARPAIYHKMEELLNRPRSRGSFPMSHNRRMSRCFQLRKKRTIPWCRSGEIKRGSYLFLVIRASPFTQGTKEIPTWRDWSIHLMPARWIDWLIDPIESGCSIASLIDWLVDLIDWLIQLINRLIDWLNVMLFVQ